MITFNILAIGMSLEIVEPESSGPEEKYTLYCMYTSMCVRQLMLFMRAATQSHKFVSHLLFEA